MRQESDRTITGERQDIATGLRQVGDRMRQEVTGCATGLEQLGGHKRQDCDRYTVRSAAGWRQDATGRQQDGNRTPDGGRTTAGWRQDTLTGPRQARDRHATGGWLWQEDMIMITMSNQNIPNQHPAARLFAHLSRKIGNWKFPNCPSGIRNSKPNS